MTLDLETILKLTNLGISVCAIIYTFFATRQKDTDERFKEGSKRMDRHENRIAALEQTVQILPGTGDIHALQLELVKQTGSLAEIRAVMDGNAKIMARLETIVSRHEDHLIGT
ncbi:DUF2730 family protein [Phaeobacter sp. JH18-32]|uniref:DUF2730 family protein n=1 Tax=Phaeobacter TaxID=302485 RepID=UPI0004081CAB|nr:MULTISPECIES: DUF2730 family protein [Phaeobacter]KII14104.1 hypothetical protein OO25_13830 [Phaeobacter sp. S60]UTS80917.1 hypothetical protein OL67_001988 [Phaeobacter piscinae]